MNFTESASFAFHGRLAKKSLAGLSSLDCGRGVWPCASQSSRKIAAYGGFTL
jgi:hypothetical protein